MRHGRLSGIGTAFAVLLPLASCGGGGGGGTGSSGGSGGALDFLHAQLLNIISSNPADQAVQVALDASLEIEFDGIVALECLSDTDTWLRPVGSEDSVLGTWSNAGDGRTVVFTPSAWLSPETDYVLQFSALTCDLDGRLLEEERQISFRSLDETAPTISSATPADSATGVSRTDNLTVTFDENVDPLSVDTNSVRLLDVFGSSFGLNLQVSGSVITVDPVLDLPGNRDFVLAVNGVEDRAGNRLESSWDRSFRTASDGAAPSVDASWPETFFGASPRIRPRLNFSESIDPASVETASLRFVDQFANLVPYRIEASVDQKSLRVIPLDELVPGRTYTMTLVAGPGAVTDLSGNPLAAGTVLNMIVGSDELAPVLQSSTPADDQVAISLNAVPTLRFDEFLASDSVTSSTVQLLANGVPVTDCTLSLVDGGTSIQIAPDDDLSPGTDYQVLVLGGPDGLHDTAGNPLPGDLAVDFRTSSDGTLPRILVWPVNGSFAVPLGAHVSALAEDPIDPATVNGTNFEVRTEGGSKVPGTVSLLRSDRVLRFEPTSPWVPGTRYIVTVKGGPGGVREAGGNWLLADQQSDFRATTTNDLVKPTVEVTVNDIDALRNGSLAVPTHGFSIDVSALDPIDYSLDMSSAELVFSGPEAGPESDVIFAGATVDGSTLTWMVPESESLSPGDYTLTARVSDLSGNVGSSAPMSLRVDAPNADVLPFERTHVVWVRFDMDRSGNGRPDFEDDLYDLGLITEGDPLGTNQFMIETVRDGVLATCNQLFSRKANGGRAGTDSVAIRFSHRQPLGVPFMQIACGGKDPEGTPGRNYGDSSTGTLGRAYYDYRNATVNDVNIGTAPGVGVFPGELFLFEARIHSQIYPSFVTGFAEGFLPLAPAMGGTSAGSSSFDAAVLDPDFDYAAASSNEKARYNSVFGGADDWAVAIGTILAHEVGHSVGLVATGTGSNALHGDSSLHNAFASLTDIMAASVGYESMTNLNYRFRDLNIAYLRHRILLR